MITTTLAAAIAAIDAACHAEVCAVRSAIAAWRQHLDRLAEEALPEAPIRRAQEEVETAGRRDA